LRYGFTETTFTASNILPVFLPDASNGFFEAVSKYFLSNNLSDISIRCDGETFLAHQFILGRKTKIVIDCILILHSSQVHINNCFNVRTADSSPVFTKMFEHEMKESKDKCVEIKDTDSKTVLEMLRFFYTGHVENMNDKALKLYRLADIYLVDNLKIMCVRSLLQDVNLENALEMYCFGKQHEIQELVKKAEQVMVT